FKINGPIKVGDSNLLGAEATLTINRQDYGVAWSKSLAPGELVVANDVKIDINVEAKQVKAAGASSPGK
ncbi:MAG TPA: YceI family protein, partial [Candidatus Angelobacter sp.]|nr:YceI family protein [Candidatus Angelobacter sp.]